MGNLMSDLLKEMHKKKGKPPVPGFQGSGKIEEEDSKEEEKDHFEPDPKVAHAAPVRAVHNIPISKPGVPKSLIPKRPEPTPLEWTEFFDRQEYLEDGTSVFIAGNEPPLFVMLHGAGHSAHSFACIAKEIKKFATVAAFDFKGHGSSRYEKNLEDFSSDTLIDETISVYHQLMTLFPKHSFVIVGHSMGGSIATKSVEKALTIGMDERIQGLVVIDVVEGTALEALPFMEAIVNDRPKNFKNVIDAIKWNLASHTIKNPESARVGTPAQLIEKENQEGQKYFTWKVDLLQSQKYWTSWFTGLTQAFLNIRIPKLLILAEKDRMDKELTIAQMQGKFKLIVYQNVGHHVHEDNPLATAKSLYSLLEIFKVPLTLDELNLRKEIGVGKFHPALKPAPWPL
eukprot:TRINITY_DN2328_c0_g3_i1.p1 TRINITY_DN2328_c0_g3~~TRINITY_DN2328_c0_g3_i1.p1  ORF type:complete len:399 (+),score=91.54 TRINITY_DN2328_c0_g3_i1:74-1270(+)